MSAYLPVRSVQCTRRSLAGFQKYALCVLLPLIFFATFPKQVKAADLGFQHGTAVVVLRSPKAVYAAVDSKEIDQVYRDGVLSTGETVACKIRKVGPYYSIVAGLMRGTNGFDALQEAAGDYKPGDTLDALSQSLQQSVPRTLAPMLAALRDQDPAAFARNYGSQAALHLTLVGNEQNTPKVVVVEFQAVEPEPGRISLATRTMRCPGDCPAPNAGYFLGAHEAVEASIRQNPAILLKPSEQEIERLIGLEYVSRPDIVGGPISMLKIGPGGTTIVRNGACALD